ncbi:MAG: two-component regulator propeller domain-containing protein [Pseudobacter sp.]|uniref:sensor histidine kinase n=1 Tax=Pseudobacter sp. TaxID=2045420 RepID=UPI003F81FD0F
MITHHKARITESKFLKKHFRMQSGSGLRRFLLNLLLLGFTIPFALRSQAQEFIFNHITPRDGLASNFVYCLWQDPKGYLWIGTENGLQRYDGYQFFSLHHGSGPDRLPKLPVNQLVVDTTGRMWLRMGKTFGIFDQSSFRYKQVPLAKGLNIPETANLFLEKDGNGHVFVLVHGWGWLFFDEEHNVFREDTGPFRVPRSFGLFVTYDDVSAGRFWIGGRNGLAYYDKKRKQLFTAGQADAPHFLLNDPRMGHHIVNFYVDVKRRHWLTVWDTTKNNLTYYCYDERSRGYSNDTMGLTTVSPGGYYELNKWMEFGDTTVLAYGLYFMAMRMEDRFETFVFPGQSPYNIEFTKVYSVIQDRENILWVATDNGLFNSMSKINSSLHLVLKQDKKRANITNLLETPGGDIWVGTWGRGVLTRRPTLLKKEITFDYPENDGNYLLTWDMHQELPGGRIWFACQSGRLMIYDTLRQRSEYLKPTPFGGSTIRQIAEDPNGNLWFGTQRGTILKWKKGAALHDSSFKLINQPGSTINKLFVDNRGLLWAATSGNGVIVLDPLTGKQLKKYDLPSPQLLLYGNHVRDVLQVNDSIYAFAGDNLILLNHNTGNMFTASRYNQWPVGPVLTMQVDNQHNVWLSTPNGMYKYNLEGNHFIRFTQWDGLITVYNQYYQLETSLKLRSGRLAFAGNANMVTFDPLTYRDKSLPPDVLIGSCKLFNDFLPVDSIMKQGGLTLPYNRNSITLSFAALSFARIDKLSYYYMLEGANKDWQRMEGALQVNYTLLPPGNYVFRVRARNEEGIYSPHITSMRITIRPPFWRTFWFFGLVGISIAGALYYLYRLRIRRLMQVEKIRTRLARDLHDDMGSTLSTINILSNMAVKKLDSDQKASQDYMGRISESSSRIMEAMDDIVWSINPVNDSMRKIVARMKEFAGNVLEASDIDYSFVVDEAVKDMTFDMEWRREIFLVFKEAVNNIVKYAKASKVDITLKRQKNVLLMTITDNGVGFRSNSGQQGTVRGNGLRNMRKRAEAMNGSLQIISAPESGTSVELRIPLA